MSVQLLGILSGDAPLRSGWTSRSVAGGPGRRGHRERPPAAWSSGESGTSPGNRLGGRIEVMAATRQSPVT